MTVISFADEYRKRVGLRLRDDDGALRVTHWRAADKRIKQRKIHQLFVIRQDGDEDDPEAA